MKFLLTIPIRMYWKLIRISRRRQCIFKVSCSQHVHSTVVKDGLLCGIKALVYRMQTCRPGYEIISLKQENTLLLVLKNGNVLQEKEISESLIRQQCFSIDTN